MHDKYAGFCLFFIKCLQHKLEKFFDRDLMLLVKKSSCLILSLIATGIVMFIIGAIFAQNLWSWKRNCFFFERKLVF